MRETWGDLRQVTERASQTADLRSSHFMSESWLTVFHCIGDMLIKIKRFVKNFLLKFSKENFLKDIPSVLTHVKYISLVFALPLFEGLSYLQLQYSMSNFTQFVWFLNISIAGQINWGHPQYIPSLCWLIGRLNWQLNEWSEILEHKDYCTWPSSYCTSVYFICPMLSVLNCL